MPCIKPSSGDDAYKFWWERWGERAEAEYWRRSEEIFGTLDKKHPDYTTPPAEGGAKG